MSLYGESIKGNGMETKTKIRVISVLLYFFIFTIALIAAIFYAVFHPFEGIILIIAICVIFPFFVRLMSAASRSKQVAAANRQYRAFIKQMYDRERRLNELKGFEFVDTELTNAIINAAEDGETVSVGEDHYSFQKLTYAYFDMIASKGNSYGSPAAYSFENQGKAVTADNGIKPLCKPLVFRCNGGEERGFSFYLFPETILTFFEGPEKAVFLAAYKPQALSVKTSETTRQKSVVVRERTQYDIRYYDKYNPIEDADIINSYWKVTNKDGSRSFKGGLKPENNPLTFELKFVELYITIGSYTAMTGFSRAEATYTFKKVLELYKGTYEEYEPNVFVDSSESVVEGDVVGEGYEELPVEVSEAVKESDIVVSDENLVDSLLDSYSTEATDISDDIVDEYRSRNRDVAKVAADSLSRVYAGKYEFKVYQVRKPRDGWGLQDAGVYTYSTDDQGNQYTIEFDLISNLESKKTELRFSIWGKTSELVADRYKTTVTKGKMNVSGEGYGLIIHRDYESMSQAEMTAQFEKDTLTLMKLIEMDVPAK